MGSKGPARAKKNGEDGRRDIIIKLTRGTRGTDVADGQVGATDSVECVAEGVIAVLAEELERLEVPVLEAPSMHSMLDALSGRRSSSRGSFFHANPTSQELRKAILGSFKVVRGPSSR